MDEVEVDFELVKDIKNICARFLTSSWSKHKDDIKGRNLIAEDFEDDQLYFAVARKLARYHSQSMPISKLVNFAEDMMKYFANTSPAGFDMEVINESDRKTLDELINFPLEEEYLWTIKVAPKVESRKVFSHNDFWVDNAMLTDSGDSYDERLMILDYELCGYNFRGYDIASALRIAEFRYESIEDEVEVKYLKNECSYETKRRFYEQYLHEIRKMNRKLHPILDTIDHLQMEAEFFALQHYLFYIGTNKALIVQNDEFTFVSILYGSCNQ
ncbi:choline/ethanolamine kinase-like protein [Dinothrombium tinctorium]|uniref:ethanolamine kinase n=1 Tax=Dinothrombium tinctorium TaxID=1965070 RepID=A0A3S3NIQ4_9ACAR|nr:choline/ethanolamine kinase-like protein [Dinothrombium tinctorium]RWS03943.1 choline/ethanolamine kinase-like protein [Dinothrombium tinctorium]